MTETPPLWRPFRGPFSRWPRVSDAVLVVLVFLCSVFVPSDNDSNQQELVFRTLSEVPLLVLLLTGVAAIGLYWRRTKPLLVLSGTIVATALSTALGYSFDFFGTPFAFYSVGRYESNTRWSQIGGAAIGLIALIQLFDRTESLPDIGFSFLILFVCWYFGRRVRARGEYLRLLQERTQYLEKETVYEAQRAVAEERARIARELHDIVAHQVSMMTVQASAAKTVAISEPQTAIEAMSAVESAGRQALIELRHMLGVLRPNSNQTEWMPQPGLDDIPQLIGTFRQAGLEIECPELPDRALPSGIQLVLYRMVQEGLTNVLKHAGIDAKVEIHCQLIEEMLHFEVTNTCPDKGSSARESAGLLHDDHARTGYAKEGGYGLIGMHERVSSLGGRFESGPCESGFRIASVLPMPRSVDLTSEIRS